MQAMALVTQERRLYFFWDDDISDEDLRSVLAGNNPVEIRWAMTRLLEAAR
jgi:hypothetical protein